MKFIIHRLAKSAMQSGKINAQKWRLEPIENSNSRSIDKLMHWVSSNNTNSQLKFEFDNKEDAVKFAQEKNYDFELITPNEAKLKPKSYADNFTN